MADEIRGEEPGRPDVPKRRGVSEPETLDRGVERDTPERKVGDRIPGEGGDEGDREERAPDEPVEGPREPQEPPQTTHAD